MGARVRFLSSHVRSFGRFAAPFTLQLERLGLVLVEGLNLDSGGAFDSNAASKSMLFEGIFAWNPFGKMPRYDNERLGSDEVCIDGRDADIANEIETARGRFRVRRHRRAVGAPRLTIESWRNDAYAPMPNVSADPLLADGDLTGLLGYDYTTSRNALFLQGTTLSAAGETFSKQMAILESLLRFDDFTRGSKLAKQRADALELEARDLVEAIDRQAQIVEQAANVLRDLEALDESIRERELTQEIALAARALSSMAETERHEARVRYKSEGLAGLAQASLQDLRLLEDRIARAASIAGVCPTCDREMQKRSVAALVKKLNARRAMNERQWRETEKASAVARGVAERTAIELERLKTLAREQTQRQRELDDLVARKSRRLALVQAQVQRRDGAEAEVVRLTAQAAHARRETQTGRHAKSSLDGLKPEVFALGAPIFDDAALRYGDILCDGAIRVALDPQRDTTGSILRISGASAPTFKGCSAGERRRIALITAFASRELARWRVGGECVNVAVWDEIFDPLDESGIRRAVQILHRDVEELESVFVVTHNEMLKSLFPGALTLTVVRENDVARVEFEHANSIRASRPRRRAVL